MSWVAAWFAGMTALLLIEVRPTKREALALLAWPIMLPIATVVRGLRNRRTRCRVCGLRWKDRAALIRHQGAMGHGR